MKRSLVVASFILAFYGQFGIAFGCILLGILGGIIHERKITN